MKTLPPKQAKRHPAEPVVKIRRASSEDAASLTAIAHEAKRHWGYPEHWITHWESDLTISPEYIEINQAYVAEDDGQALGFYTLLLKGDKAELDHMWVKPEHMGPGVGRQLFIHAMRTAASKDIAKVEILSDPNAEGFYKKMGAYREGEVTSEIDGQPRILPQLAVKTRS